MVDHRLRIWQHHPHAMSLVTGEGWAPLPIRAASATQHACWLTCQDVDRSEKDVQTHQPSRNTYVSLVNQVSNLPVVQAEQNRRTPHYVRRHQLSYRWTRTCIPACRTPPSDRLATGLYKESGIRGLLLSMPPVHSIRSLVFHLFPINRKLSCR